MAHVNGYFDATTVSIRFLQNGESQRKYNFFASRKETPAI